jgi:hypothetical protein
LLDACARLPESEAAGQLLGLARALAPVAEACGGGLHPLTGWAAAALRLSKGQIVLDDGGRRHLCAALAAADDRAAAAAGLSALAAQIRSRDAEAPAVRSLLALARGGPARAGPRGDLSFTWQEPGAGDLAVGLVRELGKSGRDRDKHFLHCP